MIADEKAFARLLHIVTTVPISYYEPEGNRSTSFPALVSDVSLYRMVPQAFQGFRLGLDYVVTDSFSYYGLVTSERTGNSMLFGPVFSTPVNSAAVHSYMTDWAIPQSSREQIEQMLRDISLFSLNRFLFLLSSVYYALNDKEIDISSHFGLAVSGTARKDSSQQLFDLKEQHNFHNTFHYEQEMLSYIRGGEVEKLQRHLNLDASLTAGTIAHDAIRQEKNIFITSATLATRAAIAGGLDVEQALLLSDLYIQECENISSVADIGVLNYTMLIDFCRRVEETKRPKGVSREVFDAIQYITRRTNEPIQVGDVAEHVHRSRSWLGERFKAELGTDVSSYIMNARLEEARNLLTHSEKSLAEISNYLCFSSQAYFQNVFKKKFGITPTQYRKDSRKMR